MVYILLLLLEIYGFRATKKSQSLHLNKNCIPFMEYTLDKYKNLVQYLLSLQFTDYSGIKDGDG